MFLQDDNCKYLFLICCHVSGYQQMLDARATSPVALEKIRVIAPKQWNPLSPLGPYRLLFLDSLFTASEDTASSLQGPAVSASAHGQEG